jgi:TonB family protein
MRMTARRIMVVISLLVVGSFLPARAQQVESISDNEIKVIDFMEIVYSPLARHAQIQGVVVVRAGIDDQGKVVNAMALSGPDIFKLDCLSNIRKWRFKPNTSKTVVVVYNFKILDGRCNSDPSLFILQGPNLATVITCPATVNPSATQ